MSELIRVRSAVAGSNQDRLEDWMVAVNDFLGISGNEWNNVPGTPPGKAWDQVMPFDGTLAGVSGQDMVNILQTIDNFNLGGADTHFASTNLTRNSGLGALTHNFNNNNLTITGTGTHTYQAALINSTATLINTVRGDVSVHVKSPLTYLTHTSVNSGAILQIREGTNNGNDYVGLTVPNAITQSYLATLPGTTPSANGKVLKVLSGGGTTLPVLEWGDSADTNFATSNLTANGTRLHEFGANALTIQGTGAHTYKGGTMTVEGTSGFILQSDVSVRVKGVSGGTQGLLKIEEATNNGTNNIGITVPASIATNYTMTLPGTTPSANGKILKVLSGGGTASPVLEWGDETGAATDTSITSGTLLVASAARAADFGGNTLSLDNMTTFTMNASTAVTSKAPALEVRSDNVTLPGELRVFEADDQTNDNYVGISVPTAIGTSYTMSLPVATPTANGKILKVLSGGGTATPVLEWGDETGAATDTSITSGTLLIASDPRTADFGGNTLSLTNASTISLSGSSTVTTTGTSLDVRNTTGTLAGKLRIFEDANAAGDNFFSISAATGMGADYDYTWPSATPAANDYVLTSSTTGTLQWQEALSLITYQRAYITLDTAYTAGTTFNLDGSTANTTLQSGDTIVLTGIANQGDLANSKKVSFWVDGIKADVAGTPGSHVTATYVSTTAISLNQNLPAGTVVEIERIS